MDANYTEVVTKTLNSVEISVKEAQLFLLLLTVIAPHKLGAHLASAGFPKRYSLLTREKVQDSCIVPRIYLGKILDAV